MQKSIQALKYLAYLGIFIIPFLALVVSDTMFFPFITGKNFLFRIIIEITVALWAIVAIFEPRYRPKKTWIFLTLAFFTLGMALSSVFGANFYRSFWSNYERMEGLITFLHLFAYFTVLISFLKTEKAWDWLLKTNIGVNVIVGLYGLLQLFSRFITNQGELFGPYSLLQLFGRFKTHQGDRLDASLGNASYMAIYMAFGLFTALLFFIRSKNKRNSIWIYVPIIALQTIVLYYTATRGAILGVIGGLFLASALIAIFAERKKVKMAAGGFALVVIILIGGFLAIKNTSFVTSSPVLNRFSGISLKERTTESRLTIWKMSWEGFMEKPVLGWGPENFNLVFNKYYEPSLYRQEPWFDRAHNVFFDRLVTGGVIGLVSYLGLFFFAVYYLWSRRNKTRFSVYDSAILTAMFAAYFTHNLFVFDNLISLILFFTFLAYIHYRRVEGPSVVVQSPESKILSTDDVYKKMYMVAGVAGLAIFSIYYLNIPGIMASKNIIYAMGASSAGDAEGSFRKFQKAISYNSFGSLESREHMTSFVLSTKDSPNVKPEIRSEMISYTIDELKKQNEEYPGDIRELIFLGMFYNKTGMYDEAEKILKEAMALSPNKQQIYFELGGLYISRNDYVNGLQTLKTAFELDETFSEARTIYAVAAIFADNEKLAEELMADYGGTVKADERFLKAYASKNNFTKVVSILNLFIEKEPNNIQHRLRLAAAYLQANQRQLAIAEIEKSIEINPSFKEQGEYYVNEIKAGRNP